MRNHVVVCSLLWGVAAMGSCSSAASEAGSRGDNQARSRPPVKIVCQIDKTGSGSAMGVVQPTPESFASLIGLIGKTGGELAVGLICDRSNRPLIRLRVEQPSQPDEVQIDRTLNPFEQEQQRVAAEEKRRSPEWKRKELQQAQLIEEFKAKLRDLLSRPANAARTDIWGAVRRSELFLNEPEAWRLAAHRYAVFITDGIDNVYGRVGAMPDTKLILVNSAGSVGALEVLKPLRFESQEAAFRYITVREEN